MVPLFGEAKALAWAWEVERAEGCRLCPQALAFGSSH